MKKDTKDKGKVLIEKFYNAEDPAIYEGDLGWTQRDMDDAGFTESSKIFYYHIVEVGLNMSFYYVDDGKFYVIETEKEPNIEVRRVYKDPNWDGEYLVYSVMYAAITSAPGEILYVLHNREDIWETVKIGGKSLEEVLARSVIMDLD